MPQKQKQAYCAQCSEHRRFLRTTPHHLIHGILTIFTCLAWGLVWTIITLGHDYRWRCSSCGSYPGLTPQEKKQQAAMHATILGLTLGGLLISIVVAAVAAFLRHAQT